MPCRLSAHLIFSFLLTACTTSGDSGPGDAGTSAIGTPVTGTTLSPDDALVYRCRGLEFTAQFSPERMDIWLQGEHHALQRERSASGIRYAAGNIEFFGKGREGMLQVGDIAYADCREGAEPDPLQ